MCMHVVYITIAMFAKQLSAVALTSFHHFTPTVSGSI